MTVSKASNTVHGTLDGTVELPLSQLVLVYGTHLMTSEVAYLGKEYEYE